MVGKFEHSRFLSVNDGFLQFGCINPFCGHGNPALPRHWSIPLETKSITISVVSHKDRLVTFAVFLKKSVRKHEAGETVELICADNLVACKTAFAELFAGKETTS